MVIFNRCSARFAKMEVYLAQPVWRLELSNLGPLKAIQNSRLALPAIIETRRVNLATYHNLYHKAWWKDDRLNVETDLFIYFHEQTNHWWNFMHRSWTKTKRAGYVVFFSLNFNFVKYLFLTQYVVTLMKNVTPQFWEYFRIFDEMSLF